MDKIITTFKNLYKEDDSLKKHLFICFLLLYSAISLSTFQLIDKEYDQIVILTLICVGILFAVISIFPMVTLSGFWLKFLNLRFTQPVGIPKIDFDCFKKGLKVIPLQIVWMSYILIPTLVIFGGLIFAVVKLMPKDVGPALVILMIAALLILCLIWGVVIFVLSPFINMVFINYSETFKYSKELFNPLIIFRYIRLSFKEAILPALQYFAVNVAVSTVVQLILGFFGAFLFLFALPIIIAGSIVDNPVLYAYFLLFFILVVSLFTAVYMYSTQVVNFALADNYVEVYKTKISSQKKEDEFEV